MPTNGLYSLAAAGLGLVAGFVLCVPMVGIGEAFLTPRHAVHPIVAGPLITAVVSASWLLRPWIRRPGRWALAAASALAMLSAVLFAFLFVLVERLVEGRMTVSKALFEAAVAMPYGAMLCLMLGYLTLPFGWCCVHVLRRVMRNAPPQPADP
jgi:hypothetical protein